MIIDLVSVSDSEIRSATSTTNYGTNGTMRVGENNSAANVWRSFVKFDYSTVPTQYDLLEVYLNLNITSYANADTGRTHRIYRTKRNWVEDEVNWERAAVGTLWTSNGAFNVADCEQTDIGSLAIPATASGWYAFTLTAAKVLEHINGTMSNYGYFVKSDTESNDGFIYSTREGTYPPYISLYYNGPRTIFVM